MSNHPNYRKIKLVARKISFLMEHQTVLPDLKEIAMQTYPLGTDPEKINYDSPEFLLGANTALMALISALEEKGPRIKE
jgi:hypothetical protein